ncbi:hypothetical protein CC2G_011973 [Coprinopsis cinerea AmutBmut pab1-1]|nr:hypothetical protein CC2G_011973 [Coprinopsis cinerea AmutBmut pab1-1]
MANYLPVLLVSVTNAVPDDSFVTTQPQAQVDYLSHDWQEEDVWKSWRNMTRQKNEIANGIRLENASWRTWWKQRNKLKTVTPETLNWLKDSDVTWLYGPLHTEIEYKPPPKAPAVSESRSSSSNVDQRPPTKPILKHRSISQLLTSDLPNSPIFSPPESDDEDSHYSPILDLITREKQNSSQKHIPKRPTLQHTKSDTHITRWGPNRAFRKDSPPRIDPPGQRSSQGYFPRVSAGGPVRSSLSQDSTSSTANSHSGERTTKKKHITFNTFVEQCIAIEKPKRSSSFYGDAWGPGRTYDFDDGYEEDQEDCPEDEADLAQGWSHQRISNGGSDSDSPYEDEEDGIIEMRSSYRANKSPRSVSKVSNASSSSSVSTASSTTNSTNNSSSPSRPSGSSSKRQPLRRKASTSTYRPRAPVHVTIAPIAPTVLKTTGLWEEGFGDDGSDDGYGWRDRMWEYGSGGKKSRDRSRSSDADQGSDGTPVELVWVPPFSGRYSYNYAVGDLDDETLELGGYEDDLEEDFASGLADSRRYKEEIDSTEVYHHRNPVVGSVGFEDYSVSPEPTESASSIPIPIPLHPVDEDTASLETETLEYSSRGNDGIPKVVVQPNHHDQDDDEFDMFGGPLIGGEYMNAGPSRGRQPYSARSKGRASDERPSRSMSRSASSRSRSKSHSRTPSPNLAESISSSSVPSSSRSGPTLQPSSAESRPPLRRSNSSNSPTHPLVVQSSRGRSASHQDLLQAGRGQSSSQSGSRGRSSTRTPSSSTWDSSASPLGSLSPDASISPRIGSAYTGNGRVDKRDRDSRRGREGGRERERGRSQTTDKRLSVSVSSSPEPPRVPAPKDDAAATAPKVSSTHRPPTEACFSSASSTSTIMPDPDSVSEEADREAEYMRLAEEEMRRKSTPTPSNSPVLEMLPALRHDRNDHDRTPTPPTVPAPTPVCPIVTEARAKSYSPCRTSPSPSKTRPPPLVPSPSHAAPQSTSYTAVSSPSPASPKPSASPHLSVVGSATSPTNEARPTLQRSPESGSSDSSLMGKAAEMVNSAGAFLGLWNHS